MKYSHVFTAHPQSGEWLARLLDRYGLDGRKPRSLALIGEIYGVSKERIRQVEKSALRKLRHPSMSSQILDFADGIPETIAENIRQSAEAHHKQNKTDTEPFPLT